MSEDLDVVDKRFEQLALEREIIADRSAGVMPAATAKRLGISQATYRQSLRRACKRAGRHLADETALYLLNVMFRLDRATAKVTEMVAADGNLAAANTLASLTQASAALAKSVLPQSLRVASESVQLNGEVAAVADRYGIRVPPPLLSGNQARNAREQLQG